MLRMFTNNIEEEEFFLSHLNKNMRILEFGSGSSTGVIAQHVKSILSIEHNVEYFHFTSRLLDEHKITNYDLRLVRSNSDPQGEYDGDFSQFTNYIKEPLSAIDAGLFDVIFIDGRARVDCAKFSVEHYLKPGGLIFIHDYGHPDEKYRRREYEVVLDFLNLEDKVFTMAKFTAKIHANIIPDENDMQVIDENKNDTPVYEKENDASTWFPFLSNVTKQLPLPDNALNTCWYNEQHIENMNRFYINDVRNKPVFEHYKIIDEFIDYVRDTDGIGTLLDLGCGTAYLSEHRRDFSYIGCDLPEVIAKCAMVHYPQYYYKSFNIFNEDASFINDAKIVVMNALIDVLPNPLYYLHKILSHNAQYVILHRQEITEKGNTTVLENPSYGGFTFHSIINRNDFINLLEVCNYDIIKETPCGFSNWENDGSSFLLRKRKSWSLYNIDHKLSLYFKDKTEGIFIEAGANDGLTQSNTMFFEFYKNWTGLLFEPVKQLAQKCTENRSLKTLTIFGALSDKTGTIELIYTPECNGLLTVVNDEHAETLMRRTKEKGSLITVLAFKLGECIKTNLAHNVKIDFLSLDVEGHELKVLKGIDFDSTYIEYLLIEELNKTPDIAQYLSKWYNCIDVLSEHDYLYKRK